MMIYIPFIIQGIVMVIDEFLIHEKRGLPPWERFGHPIDSLTVLAAFLFLHNFPYTPHHQNIYLGLCTFSCLFITKDEFIHHENSSAFEHWLHSMLFILHPVTFGCAWIVWRENSEHPFIFIQTLLISLFMVYQIFRWSPLWPKLTTRSTKALEKDGTRHGTTPSLSSAQKEKLSTSGSMRRS